jgi:DNA repair photolyase
MTITRQINISESEFPARASSSNHFIRSWEANNVTSIIYETRGRAKEYCELAANLYRGCDHCCTYCYAPSATFQKRESFCKPLVRDDVIKRLEMDAVTLKNRGESRSILLSFTTDPYCHLDVTEKLTREAIRILHENSLKVSILTKGGSRSERDFDLLSSKPLLSEYGATLVFTDESLRSEIEPFAARTEERIESLKKAHELGISTYVSLEPVWTAEQSLELVDKTYEFVDFFKVGKLNYNRQQKNVDWKQFKHNIISKLNGYNKNFYIKKDLMDF